MAGMAGLWSVYSIIPHMLSLPFRLDVFPESGPVPQKRRHGPTFQFSALLKNDLWLKNAEHANRMARKLAQELTEFPDITITQAVEANSVFAKIPMENIEILQSKCFFYVWDENEDLVR